MNECGNNESKVLVQFLKLFYRNRSHHIIRTHANYLLCESAIDEVLLHKHIELGFKVSFGELWWNVWFLICNYMWRYAHTLHVINLNENAKFYCRLRNEEKIA